MAFPELSHNSVDGSMRKGKSLSSPWQECQHSSVSNTFSLGIDIKVIKNNVIIIGSTI